MSEREAILESKIEVLEAEIARLEKHLQLSKIINYIEKELMLTRCTSLRQSAEYWKKKATEK